MAQAMFCLVDRQEPAVRGLLPLKVPHAYKNLTHSQSGQIILVLSGWICKEKVLIFLTACATCPSKQGRCVGRMLFALRATRFALCSPPFGIPWILRKPTGE